MSTKYLKQFSPPGKVSRGRPIKLKLFFVGILILGIAFLTWYLPKKEILNDREISLYGPDKFAQPVMAKINDFISQDYFFNKNNLLINSENLNKYLTDNFLEIDSIDIQKNFLKKKLTVKITEKEGIGIFCFSQKLTESGLPAGQASLPIEQSDSTDSTKITDLYPIPYTLYPTCHWFDKESFLFKAAPEITGSLVLRITDKRGGEFKLGEKPLDRKTVDNFINFKKSIKKSLNLEISDFLMTPEFYPDSIAQTTLGFNIYFENEHYEEALVKFKEIINKETLGIDLQKVKYFDLRTKDRVYYK